MDCFLDRFLSHLRLNHNMQSRLFFEWSVNPLNPFKVSARMSEAICLSFGMFAFFLCALVVTGDWQKLSIVTLLEFSSSSSVYAMTLLSACQIFSLDNGTLWKSLLSTRVSNIFSKYLSFRVAMRAHSYVTSNLFKRFLPHMNMLK